MDKSRVEMKIDKLHIFIKKYTFKTGNFHTVEGLGIK